MHLSLEQFNLLLEGELSAAEREPISDHILDCDACAAKFRALRDLHQEFSATPNTKKHPVRWALAAAAVLAMAGYPYFQKSDTAGEVAQQAGLEQMASHYLEVTRSEGRLDLLDRVQEIKIQSEIQNWNKSGRNISHIIQELNKPNR